MSAKLTAADRAREADEIQRRQEELLNATPVPGPVAPPPVNFYHQHSPSLPATGGVAVVARRSVIGALRSDSVAAAPTPVTKPAEPAPAATVAAAVDESPKEKAPAAPVKEPFSIPTPDRPPAAMAPAPAATASLAPAPVALARPVEPLRGGEGRGASSVTFPWDEGGHLTQKQLAERAEQYLYRTTAVPLHVKIGGDAFSRIDEFCSMRDLNVTTVLTYLLDRELPRPTRPVMRPSATDGAEFLGAALFAESFDLPPWLVKYDRPLEVRTREIPFREDPFLRWRLLECRQLGKVKADVIEALIFHYFPHKAKFRRLPRRRAGRIEG